MKTMGRLKATTQESRNTFTSLIKATTQESRDTFTSLIKATT